MCGRCEGRHTVAASLQERERAATFFIDCSHEVVLVTRVWS
jgi:hypothetical protein